MSKTWQEEIEDILNKYSLQGDISLKEFLTLCTLLSKNKFKGSNSPDFFYKELSHIHSEVSEVFDEYRKGKGLNETYIKRGKPEGIPIEMADIIIKTFAIAGIYDIDIISSIPVKIRYNMVRKVKDKDE